MQFVYFLMINIPLENLFFIRILLSEVNQVRPKIIFNISNSNFIKIIYKIMNSFGFFLTIMSLLFKASSGHPIKYWYISALSSAISVVE